MYLKKLKIINFRKFRSENNVIEFVDAQSYKSQNKTGYIDLAPITTLIVGKNNSGKTTVITALEKLIKDVKFGANDFNFIYLKEKLKEYEKESENADTVEPPFLEFRLTIGLEEGSKDLVTNLVPFMTISDVSNSELDIIIKFELEERQIFVKNVKELLDEGVVDCKLRLKKFVELINDSTGYKIKFYNTADLNVPFKMSDLIEIKTIKANNIQNEKSLSKAFSRIVDYRYNSSLGNSDKKELESEIEKINAELSTNIGKKHTSSINSSLASIESSDKLEMLLTSNITFSKLMSDFIKYEYVEQGLNIPENQFGLGYTNLMMIIADLIEYMEKNPEQSFNSKVNLISIEEPETFMHPQMQELFIKHINKAISSLLDGKNKKVNSQLIITTHSSHILNSKIHSGGTFNNINYITNKNNTSHVVPLNDEKITPKLKSKNKQEDNLKFLKKHIKYKVSELFFSDAIIFVEGVTEETLVRYHIDNHIVLSKYYISIFNIDGAHGLVYHELIKQVKVPSLIITDLDIDRTEDEKDNFEQVLSLKDRKTTNETIKEYNKKKDVLTELPKQLNTGNLMINYQGTINGYYASSFEEAYILTNFDNEILYKTLEELKPKVVKDITDEGKDLEELKKNSYKLQRKLSSSKSDFANKLLYKFITSNAGEQLPILPVYISDGLQWLTNELNKNIKS